MHTRSLPRSNLIAPQGKVQNRDTGECLTITGSIPEVGVAGPSFTGFVQIALAAPRTCSPTADPPGQCCLPVPGQMVSGCHVPNEPRWDYNQFFKLSEVASNGAQGGSDAVLVNDDVVGVVGDASTPVRFTMSLMSDKTKCVEVTNNIFTSAQCNSSSVAQHWTLVEPPTAAAAAAQMMRNEGSGTCLVASNPHEASSITLGPCVAGPDTLWVPMCEPNGTNILPGWPCISRPAGPPPKPPPPPPSPPISNGKVVTAPCNETMVVWKDFEVCCICAGRSSNS